MGELSELKYHATGLWIGTFFSNGYPDDIYLPENIATIFIALYRIYLPLHTTVVYRQQCVKVSSFFKWLENYEFT